MFELYFRNRKDELKLVAECETMEKCHENISAFLKERGYKSHYRRMWTEDKVTIVDVGSHSEFFEIKEW